MKSKAFKYWLDQSLPPETKKILEQSLIKISPTRANLPDWIKSVPKYYDGSNKIKILFNTSNIGVKGCYPFIDTLTSGYTMYLHCDVIVEKDSSSQEIKWLHNVPPISSRPIDLVKDLPVLPGFSLFKFAWEIYYKIQVPKGYSILITNPLNRNDLPFITSSAIVDADGGFGNGSIPFSLHSDFEGIIKAGTPIAQIIPIKRDSWVSSYETKPKDFYWNPRSNLSGWYKKNIWKKKSYE